MGRVLQDGRDLRVLAITRPLGKGEDTAQFAKESGWRPFLLHTVELKPYSARRILSELEAQLGGRLPDWIVFMSRTGVRVLLDALSGNPDLSKRLFGHARVLAVGPRTRDELSSRSISHVSVPEKYSSSHIFDFLGKLELHGVRIVLIRSSQASDFLASRLQAEGATVSTLKTYESVIPYDSSSVERFAEGLSKNEFHAVLFTSSLSAANLFKMTEKIMSPQRLVGLLSDCLVAAIGPVTAQKLLELGVKPDCVPETYLITEAIEEIVSAYGRTGPRLVEQG